jgi:hypothetical protein
MAHSGPIYNRGEAARGNRRERRPIKWKKIGLALAFMSISSGLSYALGCVWRLGFCLAFGVCVCVVREEKALGLATVPTVAPRLTTQSPTHDHQPPPSTHSSAWLALKYPTFDLPSREFLVLVTNLSAYLMSSSSFIRESTLAGEGRSGAAPPGRRPA